MFVKWKIGGFSLWIVLWFCVWYW